MADTPVGGRAADDEQPSAALGVGGVKAALSPATPAAAFILFEAEVPELNTVYVEHPRVLGVSRGAGDGGAGLAAG
ncbi:hypothetical protein [Streptomyces sp. NEAU-174]|uniref:hypothetical protein n=1 Tax=Streptomyces sp. NEAU-174 TaxID=3458254 RepID=UPI00404435E7